MQVFEFPTWSDRVRSSLTSNQVSKWEAGFQEWSRCLGGICSDLICSCALCGSVKEAAHSRGSGFKSSLKKGKLQLPNSLITRKG